MKKVLFVIPTMRMGGAERSLVSLLKALDPERVQADLLLFEAGGVLQKEIPEWIHVMEADPITRGMTLELRWYLRDLAKRSLPAAASRVWMSVRASLRSRFHLSPAFSWDAAKKHIPPLPGRFDAAVGFLEGFTDFYIVDKVTADRKIGWIHTDMSERPYNQIEERYYASLDVLAVISNMCQQAFSGRYPRAGKRTVVVPNLVLPDEVKRKAKQQEGPPWDKDRFHLITVGRLTEAKGIGTAIQTCKILRDKGVPVVWHVYGEGELRETLEKQIEEYALRDSFILEGLTDNPYPYMKASDVVVQPSRWEGKSLVLDEAKILGKAIVVTDYTSVSDQIRDGVTGIVTGMEPEQIAQGIERVLSDTGLRHDLEENCRSEKGDWVESLSTFYKMIDV